MGSMSDSSVLSSADSSDTSGGVAPDVDAKVPAVDAQSSTKAKKARKGAKAKNKASAKSAGIGFWRLSPMAATWLKPS